MAALREQKYGFVRRLKPTECHIYIDEQEYLCYFWLFVILNTIAATVDVSR